jgi:hypothetical protein
MILDAFEDTEEFSFLEDEDIDLSSSNGIVLIACVLRFRIRIESL